MRAHSLAGPPSEAQLRGRQSSRIFILFGLARPRRQFGGFS